jgi:hypothetical protein
MGADGILLVGQRLFTAVSVGGRAAVWSKVSVLFAPYILSTSGFAGFLLVVF